MWRALNVQVDIDFAPQFWKNIDPNYVHLVFEDEHDTPRDNSQNVAPRASETCALVCPIGLQCQDHTPDDDL